MLVLTRRCGDAILIDGGIRIVVLACERKGVVRIGIEAPSHLGILREEMVVEIAEQNRRATNGGAIAAWLAEKTEPGTGKP
jgi:carbon storage regulator